MMKYAFIFPLVLLLTSTCINGARILAFFPSNSRSHLLIHGAIADTLAEAGHDVTVVATLPNVYPHAKYNYVHIDLPMNYDNNFLHKVINKSEMKYKSLTKFIGQSSQQANNSLSHPTMQQFLQEHNESSFDLLILGYFMNNFHLGLGAYFKCPVIVSFMNRPIFPLNVMMGNPHEVAYVPTVFSTLVQPLGFLDRVKNFMLTSFEQIFMNTVLEYLTQRVYNYHFPSNLYPSLEEMKKNVSLVFSNHHFSQGPIRPNVPAIVEIGGIQIKEQPNPLPTDIKEILDYAQHGAILFSMGSNVEGSTLSHGKAKIMFDTLSKLPQMVLWKWGHSNFPGNSSNIIYKTWLPQDDILAHPNVKLFITHAGQGSVVESQYHGVPMVCIPLFADQPSNMANIERSGFGIGLEYLTLTEQKFNRAILEVLNNPKYRNTIKRFSVLYRDRPMTPRQTVRYWVDYVIRHKGAKHLQSPAVHMNFWQRNSLDVIGFLTLVLIIIVASVRTVCKWTFLPVGEGRTTLIKKHKFN